MILSAETLSRKRLVLQGARVMLRPPMPEDCTQWITVRGRNREVLRPFEPAWADDALTESFFRRRLSVQMQDWQSGRACAFLIFSADGRSLIGGFNINNIARGAAQYASPGYWIDQALQGRGLMTEAARLAIGYAFGPLRLHRMNAATLAENTRSRALLTRIGFQEEGFAKAYIEIDGAWRDHVLYGLTAADFRKSEPRPSTGTAGRN